MTTTNKTCPTCHKVFSTNAGLRFHSQRKKQCESSGEINVVVLALPKKHVCYRCNSKFYTVQKLNSHMNRKTPCIFKVPDHPDRENSLTFEQLEMYNHQLNQEKEQLSQELVHQKIINEQLKLAKQSNVMNNNNSHNTNTNITNNTINNVNIHVSGQEDMSHISNKQFRDCFKRHYQSIEALFHIKHFSDRKPENLNMYIENMNDEYVQVYKNDRWETKSLAKELDRLYYITKDNLRDQFEVRYYPENDDGTVKDEELIKGEPDYFLKFQYGPFVFDDLDEELESRIKKTSCEEMKLMMYNNRHAPMRHHREMEARLLSNG